MADTTGAEFVILSDPEGRVTREYGVYNLLSDGVAAPATLIVDKDGIIQWRHAGENIGDRLTALQILSLINNGST